ncbi:GvpL/GvpF family gas vesicle protein [Streptomyces sp. NBC_01341]|uniref:GvpL/GvpF family gas vesicle protein n=1 Tax=Streptomyces sp. NBC_01341 TaxID=2903831 RepID=UPI002E0DCDC8|nr:GvpL/GvpF family gas vesicle protein [Streptomyces sp. NBC_01341]
MTDRGPEPTDDSLTSDDAKASDDSALYVFAVCDSPAADGLAGLPGVAGGGPLRQMRFGALAAVVQDVRAADFTDEVWQARMSDHAELEQYARAHHQVVSAAAASCPTVPLPLATLYHDEERARDALVAETPRFRTALERTAGRSEWGVKVYAPVLPAAADAAPRDAAVPGGRGRPAPGAGLAYLERKRGVQAQREQRHEESLRLAESVDAAFHGVATAGRRLRLHAPELTESGRVQVLNATYLVEEHRFAELHRLARALREATGARIEVSGPWVPYSFVGEV